jgi:branched-chain amino acid transport system ATP-binding protein
MLRVENLDVFYGDVQALNGVSLDIEEGAIVAIVGANGAGKTTLIRAIAGMQRRMRGQVLYRGTDIAGWPSYRVCNLGIGQVAEGRQVFPTLTVAENLDVGAMLPRARAGRGKNKERVLALFPVLAERARQAAGTLSGGEQQMLAISRAMATNPRVLMLDELSMGLAPLIVEELYEVVGRIAAEDVAILIVEQFAHEVLGVANTAAIMLHGRVQYTGTPAEVGETLQRAYLGGAVE